MYPAAVFFSLLGFTLLFPRLADCHNTPPSFISHRVPSCPHLSFLPAAEVKCSFVSAIDFEIGSCNKKQTRSDARGIIRAAVSSSMIPFVFSRMSRRPFLALVNARVPTVTAREKTNGDRQVTAVGQPYSNASGKPGEALRYLYWLLAA